MIKALFSVWTGPCGVQQYADYIREAGLTVVCEGTETIYVKSEGETEGGASWNILVALVQKHGTDFYFQPKMVRHL